MLRLRPLTVRARLVLMATATTFAALVLCAAAMLIYELASFQQAWLDDMQTQAEIVALASVPALNFNDNAAARQNLNLLKVRPHILAGAIYASDGHLFAAYARSALDKPVFLARPGQPGYRIERDRLMLYRAIVDQSEQLGMVYLEARYPGRERLVSYVSILGVVMLCSLLLAAVVASRLQRDITQPLAAVTAVAHEVMQRQDFSLRVHTYSSGEIGTLVDAFNAMLTEVARRSADLQHVNQSLQREMAVRQQAEQSLLVADRRKDEFLATLAHELRNPLAPIRTGLDIMRLQAGDATSIARARSIMERQLRQMVRLVDDLLDISRISTGKLTVRRAPTLLQSVVDDALQAAMPLIEQQHHHLAVALPERPLVLDGDATRLSQILINLLNNAAKYTSSRGTIALAAQVEGGLLVIRISDSGIGIAADMLEQIFQMFVQVDNSLERSTAGLGVGLALARHLAELHGGSLFAHSAGVGLGSEFVLQLPLPAQSVTAMVPEAVAAPQGGRRILLVDDNMDFVDSFGDLLRSLGHTVAVQHNGIDALTAVAAFIPEFAFLDIGMPGMSGYDLARTLRGIPALSATTLVALTGWGQHKDRLAATAAGFDAHLVKPVSIDQVLALIGRQGTLSQKKPR